MGREVRWFGELRGPAGDEGWALLASLRDARVVARSRTALTEEGLLDLPSGEVRVFRKVYAYRGFGAKVRGMFRTTFLARSRAAREADALRRLHGMGLAPAPLAMAEERTLGFLDEAMLATRAVPGGRDLSGLDPLPGLAAAAGRAAGRMHAAGLGRLDLAPRNLVAAPSAGGGWEILKVDSGAMAPVPRGGTEQAADLADLLAGLEDRWGDADLAEICRGYAEAAGAIPAGLEEALPAARAALGRRAPRA